MCGIAGIFNIKGGLVANENLQSMSKALQHRGPDGEGFYCHENIGLAHRRLAIIDTSDLAAQPMHSKDGNWVIVFNGCVYNYKALQKTLIEQGHVFTSHSDTEVIIEGIAEEGISFIEKIDGMFAIAVWDKKNKECWLCRDRYGIKPLYYSMQNGVLIFASEIKAFLRYPGFKVELNAQAANEYFSFQNLFSFHTLFKGVNLLPPASLIKVSAANSNLVPHIWWDYDFTNPDPTLTWEDAVSETKRLLEAGVNKQLIADVPVGAYLSGGMDSGSVTTLASRQIKNMHSFTAGFEMDGISGTEAGYDERIEAAMMASYNHTNHYEAIIGSGHLGKIFPKLIWQLEDLKVGMSYPNYYISQLASNYVKVCLQGTGGDELYGGYPWRYYRIFKSLDSSTFYDQYYAFWQRLVADDDKVKLFQPNLFSQVDIQQPRRVFEKVFSFNNKLQYDTPEQHIQNSLYFEIKTFLPGLFLVGDKLSMAHGLEERFPFMDNELVAFAQRIPVKYKLANLELMKRLDENEAGNKIKMYQSYADGKNVLRQAMKNIIPEEVLNRKKQGFSAPDENWYRGANAAYVKELLLGKKIVSAEFIQPAYVEKIIDEHINQRINHRLLLWSLMCFEWWCRIFLNNEKLPE